MKTSKLRGTPPCWHKLSIVVAIVFFASLSGLFYFAPTAHAATTYTWNNSTPPIITESGTVTINGTISGTLTVPAGAAVTIEGTATGSIGVSIDSGATVDWKAISSGDDAVHVISLGIFNMISGSISSSHIYGCALSVDSGTVTINGGTITGTNHTIFNDGGTVTISGGTITGTNSAIFNETGTVVISGGTINGDITNEGTDDIIVNGGTINGEIKNNGGGTVKYGVKVNNGTGGGNFAQGADVTITATIPNGKKFKDWTVNSGGVTLADSTNATTTFTMPASVVEVTATFEDIPPEKPKEPHEPPQPPNDNGATGGGGNDSYIPPDMTPFHGVSGSDPKPDTKPETTTPKDAPSDWAKKAVEKALELKLVPARLQGGWSAELTRADFCALAVRLYEHLDGKEITARGYFDDTTDINVQKLAGLGIVTGGGTGKFDPDGVFTREMAITLMYNMMVQLGHMFEPAEPSFADADSISPWAKAAIGALQKAGVVSGDGQYFNPALIFTREMGIVTVMNFLERLI